jgi:hypothetical protein
MEHTPNNVTVFACGGAGINIVGSLPALKSSALATAKTYAVDTSKSNLRESKFPSENVYLFEGVDGSGKVRAENHTLISKTTKQILQKFKPSPFNIVVSSGGGGSGAVIAGSIVAELLAENTPVIVILIGSTNSLKEIENTEKSFKTFDNLAHTNDCPVIMHYLENSADAPRSKIDGGAHAAIQALLMLFSGLNAEMDTADLRNWVKHAGAAEVFSLQFCPSADAYAKAGTVISVATLATVDQATGLEPSPAYQTVGYMVSRDGAEALPEPLHFTLSGNLIDTCAKNLNNKRVETTKRLNSGPKRDRLVNGNDNVGDNGVVL